LSLRACRYRQDFVFDTCGCANGQTLKCLTIIDEWIRECLAIDVAGGIRSGRVIEVLTQLVSVHGAPRYLRSDNGPEFVACAILRWSQAAQIETALIDPGKPWQNGADESFNGKFGRPVPDAAVVPQKKPGRSGRWIGYRV
jgi:putative transposase